MAGLGRNPLPATLWAFSIPAFRREEVAPPGLPEARVGRALFVCAQCHPTPQLLLNCNGMM